MPKQENLKSSEVRLLNSNSPQNLKQIEQKNPEITFKFSFFYWIASVTSHLRENEAENP